MNLFTKQKQTYRHSKLMVTKGERDNGINRYTTIQKLNEDRELHSLSCNVNASEW